MSTARSCASSRCETAEVVLVGERLAAVTQPRKLAVTGGRRAAPLPMARITQPHHCADSGIAAIVSMAKGGGDPSLARGLCGRRFAQCRPMTTRSISSRNSRLRVFFVDRFSGPGLAWLGGVTRLAINGFRSCKAWPGFCRPSLDGEFVVLIFAVPIRPWESCCASVVGLRRPRPPTFGW